MMMSMRLAICELGEYNPSQKKEFVNNPCPFYKNHHNGSIHFYKNHHNGSIDLMRLHFGDHHHVTMDNWFTSPKTDA
jgi:hypothetical protein